MKDKIKVICEGVCDGSITPQDGIDQLRALRGSGDRKAFEKDFLLMGRDLIRKTVSILGPLLWDK